MHLTVERQSVEALCLNLNQKMLAQVLLQLNRKPLNEQQPQASAVSLPALSTATLYLGTTALPLEHQIKS